MEFFKSLIEGKGLFNDTTIVGLSGLRKKDSYIKITVPEGYKKTYIPQYENNYLLF